MNVNILEKLGLKTVEIPCGQAIIAEGRATNKVFVLVRGKVVINANGHQIAQVDSPGTIFGEISALLKSEPVATVSTVENSAFYEIPDFLDFMKANPEVCVGVAQVLACRLVNMNKHFVHIKNQIGLLQKNLEEYLPVFPERLES